jgi:AraC-like DNA-binding protein
VNASSAIASALKAPRSRHGPELARLIASRAVVEGTTLGGFSGVCYYRASSPVRVQKAVVPGPRLLVVGQGRKVAKFRGGELVYDEQSFLVVTGETYFEAVVSEATAARPYLEMCMELPPEVVARTLLAVAHAPAASIAARGARRGSPLPAFVSELDPPLAGALVRLIAALDDRLEREVIAPLVLEEIVFRLLRCDGAAVVREAVGKEDATIQRAMQFIRENAARTLSVEDMARHVGMSASHFAHRFSAVARVSPMRYVKHVRLESARELMLGGSIRVAEAAARVGYESASHFTRDFKLAYGAAPAEYSRRFRTGAAR